MAARRLGFLTTLFRRNPAKRDALARLLNPGDLPGKGWRRMGQRVWPTGSKGPDTEWAERARAIGSLTSWRSFQNRTIRQWLWLQLVPLASIPDANAEFEQIRERGLRSQGVRVRVKGERVIAVEPFSGASKVWAFEQDTTSGLAGPGVNRLLVALVGSNVVVVCSSGAPVINWSAMSGLAARQSQRVPPPPHLQQRADDA